MAGKHHTWFYSTRLFILASIFTVLAACSGGSGGGGALPTTGAQNINASAHSSAVPAVASSTVPPQGVYNSCEIDTALTSMCEQEDAAMASDGFKWEINYIALMANKTGTQSLQAWFTYDASIGLGQVINLKNAITDPSNALTGTSLVTYNGDSNLAKSCGATNNEQVISCIYQVASSVPGFNFKWYIYDEPGCPNQSIGYCQGTLAGHNYQNVQTLAKYIRSIDPSHEIIGTQIGDNGNQSVINNLFSWLSTSSTPTVGFDHYPIPSGGNFGSINDIGTIAGQIASTIATSNPSENMYFVGQAFSWFQESGRGCTSISVCPFPTTAQLQQMRDQALYYANKAGKPLSMIFWYYWPDITCLNTYPGCNAAANRASLKSAAFAPFPTSPSGGPTASPAPTGSPVQTATPAPTTAPVKTATPAPPAPTATPIAGGGTLPPQGVYNSCEIDSALTSMCEQEDAAMASDGFKWEINYIGVLAHKTGNNSLQSWFTYDAGIGMGQYLNIKAAITDSSNPSNVLTATGLVNMNGDPTLANDCGATNNEQVIQCIVNVAATVPSFNYKWYLYDEPGCPNQANGYCQSGYPSNAFNNIAVLANYIHSIDPNHQVVGVNVGNTTQSGTNDMYSWLMGSTMQGTMYDWYPYPTNVTGHSVQSIGSEATYLANLAKANNPSESIGFVGQAFSWLQEGMGSCTSISACPFPTTAQLQDERDQALYYSKQAGKPLSTIFWYYWPDITCLNNYAGCNAAANRASLKSAAFAPFPVTAPQ